MATKHRQRPQRQGDGKDNGDVNNARLKRKSRRPPQIQRQRQNQRSRRERRRAALAFFGLQAEDGHYFLQVFPDFGLGGGIAEEVGGMIGGHQFCAAEIEPLAAEFGDALGGLQQGLRGAAAKRADHFGFDGVNLAHQEWGAGGDFVFFGKAIFRGATFYYVGDVDVFALQAHGFDHVGEKFSGTADERFAAEIFVTARAFADEHQVGVGIASAEDDLGAAFVELAAGAVADVFADSRESVACDAFNGFEERWRGRADCEGRSGWGFHR